MNDYKAVTGEDYGFLFRLLEQRPKYACISHRTMPTWAKHVEFCDRKPYREWWIITRVGVYVGAVYLTYAGEVGIAVDRAHQKVGIAKEALRWMMERHEGRLLANVSPFNVISRSMFEGLGWKLVQVTYERSGKA